MNFLIIIGVIVTLVIAFVVWRVFATVSGSSKRDSQVIEMLQPIIDKLQAKKLVNKEEIFEIANYPENRLDLYQLLKYHNKEDLFPDKYLNKKSMGEGALAYWLLHPNEYGKVPRKIEYVSKIEKRFNNKPIEYFVYKFFDEDDKQWKVGVAGPFQQNQEPYAGYPGTVKSASPKFRKKLFDFQRNFCETSDTRKRYVK